MNWMCEESNTKRMVHERNVQGFPEQREGERNAHMVYLDAKYAFDVAAEE